MFKSPYYQLVKNALSEDSFEKDITSIVLFGNGGGIREGYILAKQELILSGLDVAREVFRQVSGDVRFVARFRDGDKVAKGERVARVVGYASHLLGAERVALNFLAHLSGIATLTRRFVEKVKPYRCAIFDTRKTTPGLRLLEKKAVRDGGGKNHRFNLSEQYLIKDNHITACGGVREALERVRDREAQKSKNQKTYVEIEVKNIRELKTALIGLPDIILLDNMKPAQIRECVKRTGGNCLLEVSGGVNLKNVKKIAQTGVARISVGALTHSAPAVDMSFELE